jgi:hypothetical protein
MSFKGSEQQDRWSANLGDDNASNVGSRCVVQMVQEDQIFGAKLEGCNINLLVNET